MSLIFDRLIQHGEDLRSILKKRLAPSPEKHKFPWGNYVYCSVNVRRAHLDIVDKREDKKLYMMHLCVFPHKHSDGPIYGFDLIAGPKKVTGAFHDMSPGQNKDHPLLQSFAERVMDCQWKKERELPDWAKEIFSENMIAAGNVRDLDELEQICKISIDTLNDYLDYFAQNDCFVERDFSEYQNKYCRNQKMNPHTPKVMESLGFDKELVRDFIDTCLFPELVQSQ